MLRCLICLGLVAALGGCQRPWYRRSADRETYAVEREHEDEARWPVANTDITPPPDSRLYDPFNPDYPPIPPDDPAAHFYMHHPDRQHAPRTYHRDGDAPWIEDPAWRDALELDRDGYLVLSPERAVELGLLHSREYQQALENLYTTSLTLTLDRFEFAMHWFGINNTVANIFGAGGIGFSTLNSATDVGFTRNLAAGGQLLVDFANNVLVTFGGGAPTVATSNFTATLVQPLLRNAGRRVRLEALIQGERNLLYAVRTFARFREQFYVGLTFGNGNDYLGLLSQVQNIRNQESNFKSQEQNLRLHEALLARGTASTIQVDQVFQSYQQARLAVLQGKTSLETSLDSYKQVLGLPPDLKVKLDDTLLDPFQLASPQLEKLQGELEVFFAEYRELDKAPPLASLRTGFDKLKGYHGRLVQITSDVEGELERWRKQPDSGTEEEAQRRREEATRAALERQIPEFKAELGKLAKELAKDEAGLAETTRPKDWETLQKRARQLIASAAQLYVVQSQVRVFLIQLPPVFYTLEEASAYARDNRLDLMNQRGQVVDAWRQIAVTASALKAGLDVRMSANIATSPFGNRPFDFSAAASQYTVGLAFASPLNRLAERNAYRASLIAYQQARRSFMALDDQIQAAVRQDIRQLELDRASFRIARQQLISAARQVEASRDRLLIIPNADTTGTIDVLNALSALLGAKTTLITSWINYQNDRAQLLLDMGALRLDSRGLPDHELLDSTTPARLGSPASVVEELPALGVRLRRE
jgi:outer membrane protein TolC